MKIEFSSELMDNQKHAAVMTPQSAFAVLQTQQGHGLIFSIGSDNVFYCTIEVPADGAGWAKIDLSQQIAGGGTASPAKVFSVAASSDLKTVDIVVAVSVSGADRLYVCRNIANDDAVWRRPLDWVAIPYDDKAEPQPKLTIVGTYVTRVGPASFIAIDIVRDPVKDPVKLIRRFFIDPAGHPRWKPAELPINLQAGEVRSAMGRSSSKERVDGIYTRGSLVGRPQLIYVPLYNVFDPNVPPRVTNIPLPPGAKTETSHFALSVHDDGSTDLFVASAGALYFLAAGSQKDGAQPIGVYKHPLLNDVQEVHVDNRNRDVVVWGRNGRGNVFYLRTTFGKETTPGAWSTPIPLLASVVKLDTSIGAKFANLTMFASLSDGRLVQLTQDPLTTLWQRREIVLPATDKSHILHLKTYTTHIALSNDNRMPLSGHVLELTSSSPVSVYINNEYCLLSTSVPVKVKSDASGSITIVQQVRGLGAVYYNAVVDGKVVNISPLVKTLERLSVVKKGSDLNVSIPTADGRSVRLVPASVSSNDKSAAADMIKNMNDVVQTMPANGSTKSKSGLDVDFRISAATDTIFGLTFSGSDIAFVEGFEAAAQAGLIVRDGRLALSDGSSAGALGESIPALAGDVFDWMEHAIEKVDKFFVTVVGNVTRFVVEIAGELYHFLVDCVADVVHGIQFVLNKIKVFIDELIAWLGWLFVWPDIVRTHAVVKNIFKQYVKYAVDAIDTLEQDLRTTFDDIQKDIDKWANLPSSGVTFGSVTKNASQPAGMKSPQATFGATQLKNNITQASSGASPQFPDTSELKQLLGAFVAGIKKEGDIFDVAVNRVRTEIVDKIETLTLSDIVKKIIAIFVDTLLETAENLMLTALDIIKILVTGVMDLIDCPLDIPVLSWLYKEYVGSEMSVLDILCLVVAMPVTIVYKIANGRAPFPDDRLTSALIAAKSFKEIGNAYASGTRSEVQSVDPLNVLNDVFNISAGVGATALCFIIPIKAVAPNFGPAFFAGGLAYIPFVSPSMFPLIKSFAQDKPTTWYDKANTILCVIATVKTMVDISLYKLPAGEQGTVLAEWNFASVILEFVINFVWEAPAIGQLVDQGTDALASFFGNTAFNAGGWLAPGLLSEEPTTKGEFVSAIVLCTAGYGVITTGSVIPIPADERTPLVALPT